VTVRSGNWKITQWGR